MNIYYFVIDSSIDDLDSFIAIGKHKGDYIYLDDKYILYGLTNNDKLAKRFKSDRNIKCIKSNSNKEYYDDIADRFSHLVITKHKFVCSNISQTTNKFVSSFIELTCTEYEYDLCTTYKDDSIDTIFTKIFDGEFIENLLFNKLHFVDKLNYALNGILGFSEILSFISPREDINLDVYLVNELGLFVYLFENTLRLE